MRARMLGVAAEGVVAGAAKPPQASPTRFALALRAADSNRLTSRMKAPEARPAQRTRLQMKGRSSRPSFLPGPVPARLPIHFYYRERLARAFPEMAPEHLDRTAWYPAILLEKAAKVRAEDAADRAVAGPEEVLVERAALVAPEVAQAADCSAELPAAGVAVAAECLAGAAD
jgi:hypothetical protein